MKTLNIATAAACLLVLKLTGCIYYYDEPREPMVYRQAPPPAQNPYVDEQYRPVPAPAETVEVVEGPEIAVGDFHDQLAPFGRWIVVEGYGNCFVPADCPPGWRPYTLGRWVYTDSGMCWVSDERFGWACYHYGRWLLVDGIGWVWVPSSHWGPAWVAWRNGGGYCGWAPLPPGQGGVEVLEVQPADVDLLSPTIFVFCDAQFVTNPHVHDRCLGPERNITVIHETLNITNIAVINNRVVNRSWDQDRLSRATGRDIRPVELHRAQTIEEYRTDRRPTPAAANDARPLTPEQRTLEPTPAEVSRGGYDAEVERLNQEYEQRKAEMNQRYAMERRQHPPGPGGDDVDKRQAAESEQLEREHQQKMQQTRQKYHQQ